MSDYKLLRPEPTAEMVSEGARHLQIMSLPEREAASVFRAMHAVAPAVQVEPVGEAGLLPGTKGFTTAVFESRKVPEGTKLYTAPQPSELQPDVSALVEALEELVDLMEYTRQGEYFPDSFTTQPARIALATLRKGEES